MQRLRVRFARQEELKFISHLDLIRLWERSLRRAQVPLAYSEGFNPHPRISLAAPLALGVTSDAELMDIFLSRYLAANSFESALAPQLPAGLALGGVLPVPLTLPSLQSQVRQAEYSVRFTTDESQAAIENRIRKLLELKELSWHHERDTGTRRYDLRRLIDNIRLVEYAPPTCHLAMRLRCDSAGSGRPEQVMLALGIATRPQSIHRTRLILETR